MPDRAIPRCRAGLYKPPRLLAALPGTNTPIAGLKALISVRIEFKRVIKIRDRAVEFLFQHPDRAATDAKRHVFGFETDRLGPVAYALS